ncbi:hypothetical protein I302_101633 [Kwoniella bestiolae CBS 10118]|uniref:Transcription factor domain-containing protein n=1 Tax=Kwoniella bestiolae CBS 10118 TaxID=1296100 RepID=A0A1B9GCS9_9TREE|nr:hypothetical protein I302_00313 [Kwoniella bestiolae CBS 10118]OCF28824.1 hypothetical protein I302_00313 [Kwoniella bestiolae CBS 10118]
MLVDERGVETAAEVIGTPLEYDHQPTLLQVDKRAARIEQMVAQILRREGQSSRTASHLEDSDFGTEDHEETWSGAARQLLGGIGQLRDARLLDPVRLGLVSEEDMNMRLANEEWMQPILSDVALWYTSMHRAAIYSFFTSPSCSTQSHCYPLTTLLPLGLAQPLNPTLFYLALESELLEMLRPLSTAIRVLRTARLYQETHTASIIAAADDLKISLDSWRSRVKQASLPSTDYLIILSFQIEMTIYLRASTEAGPALPTPLGHERRSPIISRLGKEYMRANLDHIRHLLDQQVPLGTLPSWNFMLSFLPCATLRSIKQLHEPDVPFDLDLLESYQTYLIRCHPTASGILDGIGKTRTDPGWKSHADSQGPDISPPLTNDLEWWTMFDWLPPLESSLGTDLFTDIGLGL